MNFEPAPTSVVDRTARIAPNRKRVPVSTLWFWCGIGFALLGTVLALIPHPPPIMPEFSWLDWLRGQDDRLKLVLAGDKLEHVIGFGLLMAWFCQLYVSTPDRLRVSAALLAHAALIEGLQSFTTWRSAEFGDWVAGALGVGLGALVSYPHAGCVLGWLERWQERRDVKTRTNRLEDEDAPRLGPAASPYER